MMINKLFFLVAFGVYFSVFVNRSMFVKHHQVSLKDATNSTDESVFHPLPTLFRLLGLSPFKKVVVGPLLLVFIFILFYFSRVSFISLVY